MSCCHALSVEGWECMRSDGHLGPHEDGAINDPRTKCWWADVRGTRVPNVLRLGMPVLTPVGARGVIVELQVERVKVLLDGEHPQWHGFAGLREVVDVDVAR